MASFKTWLVAATFLTASQGAFAQQVPDAGQQIRQIPPPPQMQTTIPDIRIAPKDAPAASASDATRIRVDVLRVTGQTVFAEAELIAATGFQPGEMTLGDLRIAAAKITSYYNSRGYILAQAYVPAQDVTGSSVTIAVVEGRYGAIELQNKSSLRDGQARDVLYGLNSGDLVTSDPLERRLLLLSDIPGVAVSSTLRPGSLAGTSDLIVNVEPGRRVTGVIEADNGGNRYTGEYRAGGTVNFNNLTGHGDVASFRLLASNLGMFYGRAAYQTQVGLTTVGVSYAHIRYDLGREFKSLDASGTAHIASIYASHPLIRSRDHNLNLLTVVEAKWFKDRVGLTASETSRATRSVLLGLSGNFQDDLGGGAWSTYAINATFGRLMLRTASDYFDDAVTARSPGTYGKLQASASRLQTIAGPLAIFTALSGQLATRNLDSSEKMQLGGAYGVRAYPEGEAYGDEGYLVTIEARLTLAGMSSGMPGRLQLVGFVDAGAVRVAKNPWFTGSNRERRSGYGAGITWYDPGNFIVKAAYARKLVNTPATSAPDRSGRFWIQFAKFF